MIRQLCGYCGREDGRYLGASRRAVLLRIAWRALFECVLVTQGADGEVHLQLAMRMPNHISTSVVQPRSRVLYVQIVNATSLCHVEDAEGVCACL